MNYNQLIIYDDNICGFTTIERFYKEAGDWSFEPELLYPCLACDKIMSNEQIEHEMVLYCNDCNFYKIINHQGMYGLDGTSIVLKDKDIDYICTNYFDEYVFEYIYKQYNALLKGIKRFPAFL